MTSRTPTVMVSSTFYDLRQVRNDLREFISVDMGFNALLSEHDSFPVDPGVDTIENCRRRVEKDADILVLVVGGRYGYVDSASARSVTNLEYLAARAKRIPVYAFVERAVLAAVPLWQANQTADFSAIVDDPRVFAFIYEVRTVHKIWTQEFGTAQEIVSALRGRFANLTYDGLHWANRVRSVGHGDYLDELRGRALALALERPRAWEYRLLFQIVCDGIARQQASREEHRIGLAIGARTRLLTETFSPWASERLAELVALGEALQTLFGGPLADALGPPGQPGDPAKILFVSQRIVAVYVEALAWAQRVRRISADDHWMPAAEELAAFADGIVEGIESWASDGHATVESDAKHEGEPIHLTLTIEIPDERQRRFREHLKEISRHYGLA
jgi:hypothetical protein